MNLPAPALKKSFQFSGLGLVTLSLVVGCSPPDTAAQDAAVLVDGSRPDAARGDVGPGVDARPADARPADAQCTDARLADAAADAAGLDAHAPPDGALPDAGSVADAGHMDAARDADPPDGALDAAPPDPVAFGGFSAAEVAFLQTLTGPVPLPPDPTNRFADDPAAARLGQALFYTDDFSPVGRDCAFCHPPNRAFSGELSYDGHGGLRFRHAPSLLNVAFQPWLFWDGHADTLWAQVPGPLEDHDEMASDRLSVVRIISEDAELRPAWEAIFGPLPDVSDSQRFPPAAKPTAHPAEAVLNNAWQSIAAPDQAAINQVLAHFSKAVAAYTRRLQSFDSPFDRYVAALLAQDNAGLVALSPAAQRGLVLFVGEAGCVACHNGPTFSDGNFHNVGLEAVAGRPEDLGRFQGVARVLADPFNAAGAFSDDPGGPQAQRLAALVAEDDLRGRFKTPTLRNVARTGTWMHDGRFRTLLDVVRYKTTLPGQAALGARDPLLEPVPLDEPQLLDLVAFLESLTGQPTDPALIGRPALP